jgi:flagellar basal body rod protein FlgG
MISREQDRLQAITENLANCNMPGFKKLDVGELDFDTLLNQSVDYYNALREKGRYDPVFIDFTEGAIQVTEQPLDFAIQGEGFFAVTNENGKQLLTRNGSFKVAPNGLLQNHSGMPIQGQNGEITIPPEVNLADLFADGNGVIRDRDNNIIGQLKVVTVDDPRLLNRAGTALYNAPEDVPVRDADEKNFEVVHRAVESSNTTIYNEMAEMISCMRAYEANQKMVRAHDENQGKMISTFG